LVEEPNQKGVGNTSEECRPAFDKPTYRCNGKSIS